MSPARSRRCNTSAMTVTAAPGWLKRKLGSPDEVAWVGFGPPFSNDDLAELRRVLVDALESGGLHLDEVRTKRRTMLVGADARNYANDPAHLESTRRWWWNRTLVWRSSDRQS